MARQLVRLLVAFGIFAGIVSLSLAALARPGGGQHFSGGHSSTLPRGSSHSGGGGDGGLFQLVFWLLLDVPWLGIPLLLVVAFIAYRTMRQGGLGRGGTDGDDNGVETGATPVLVGHSPRRVLETLRGDDPAFSLPLFEDFLTELYTQTQELRGAHKLEALTPFLSAEVRAGLAAPSAQLTEVKDVIVGGLAVVGVAGLEPGAERVSVRVRFETNVTEVAAGKSTPLWLVEVWTLERKRTARSRPKGAIELLRCPSCGAPFDGTHGSVCSYCRQVVDTGEFDWVTTGIDVLERQTAIAPEEGGRPSVPPPTIVDPDAERALAALGAADPAFDWQAFAQRAGLIFGELQVAWSSLNWPHARPYVTDNLYKSQLYWIDRYKRTHRRNVTEGVILESIDVAACVSDAAYDAITVRLWAHGLDYTLDETTGKVVEGSRTVPQRYSEYWTFLRGHGVTGRPSTERTCPSCGAPVQVTMAGECAHCRAHLTSGDFDWVLSRIEQDWVYG